MSGATSPLPSTPLSRGAQLKKHRDNFTFTYPIQRQLYLYLPYTTQFPILKL